MRGSSIMPYPPSIGRGTRLPGVGVRLIAGWAWLLLWHLYHKWVPCPVALGLLVPIAFAITLGMAESALLRRRALLNMYLRAESVLFRLFRGGALLIAWQTAKALALAILLFVGSTAWRLETWLVLGLDVLLLAPGYVLLVRLTASQARGGYQAMLARRVLTPINTLGVMVVILAVEFHAPHPDLRGLTLIDALTDRVTQVQTTCQGVGILARAGAAVDTMSWWLAETQLSRVELTAMAPAAWLAFLAASLTFLWAWSRFLLGLLVSPSSLQGVLRQGRAQEPIA
jgi:hypothetical protein